MQFRRLIGAALLLGAGAVVAGPVPPPISDFEAKGGMDHMTQGLAQGWGKHNIQVNALLPGLVDTEMMPCTGPNKNKLVDYAVKRTPTGTYGRPEDFYGITVLLSSPASDFITGSIIVMDGGICVTI